MTVKTQPTNKWQTCAVTAGTGNVAAAAVNNVAVTCTTNTFNVSGTVTGLSGTGLVLQDNAGDNLAVAANGTFKFATAVASGSGYLVTTLTNPSNASQTCTVTNGSGNIAGADVTNVAVNCVTNTYTVGGTVAGLSGTGFVLQNNGGNDLAVTANGAFHFTTEIQSGQTYAVTVKTQPGAPNQACVVTGGTGTVMAGNVVSVSVNCTTDQYTVGGTVAGLAGTGLVLQNNAGNDLPVNANGGFAFPPQNDATPYAVTVKTQPSANSQTCTVTNGTGTLAGANYSGVTINCVTNNYTVGGTVSGLTGTVVLTDNGGDALSVSANGTFTFVTSIASGATYAVAVQTNPAGMVCSVTNGSGTVTSANVTSVSVACVNDPCSGYGGTRVAVNANIRVCQTTMTWGAWNPALIGGGWQVCTLAQWASYAPAETPMAAGVGSAYNTGTIWINNSSCGAGAHHEVYYAYNMNDATCYNGSNCCWSDNGYSLPIAICSP